VVNGSSYGENERSSRKTETNRASVEHDDGMDIDEDESQAYQGNGKRLGKGGNMGHQQRKRGINDCSDEEDEEIQNPSSDKEDEVFISNEDRGIDEGPSTKKTASVKLRGRLGIQNMLVEVDGRNTPAASRHQARLGDELATEDMDDATGPSRRSVRTTNFKPSTRVDTTSRSVAKTSSANRRPKGRVRNTNTLTSGRRAKTTEQMIELNNIYIIDLTNDLEEVWLLRLQ
jgi:hypothetical protein